MYESWTIPTPRATNRHPHSRFTISKGAKSVVSLANNSSHTCFTSDESYRCIRWTPANFWNKYFLNFLKWGSVANVKAQEHGVSPTVICWADGVESLLWARRILLPSGHSGLVVPCAVYPTVPPSLPLCSSQYHDDVMKWKHFPRNWPFDAELWCFLWSASE